VISAASQGRIVMLVTLTSRVSCAVNALSTLKEYL